VAPADQAARIGLRAPPGHAFGLDLVRALAVSSVLVAHGSLFFTQAFPAARYLLIVFGVCGVEIFFALSGFLVGRQLLLVAEGTVEASAFVLRRWYRTLPNYYLFLAVNAALAVLVTGGARPDADYLIFAQSLAAPAHVAFFPESWSLAIEEWFYALAALGFAIAAWRRLSPRALGLVLLAILVAGPLARYLAQLAAALPMDEGVRKISLLRLDALVFGLGCAWIERYRGDWFEKLTAPAVRLAALGIVAACVAVLAMLARELDFFGVARSGAWRWSASLLCSALPLATALWLPWLSRWETWASPLAHPVRKASEWSYAIYLTHFPTLLAMLALWPVANASGAGLAGRTVVWLAIAVALAAAVYRWYEHPLTMRRPPLRRDAPQPG
jgi:peptidoglycan/LPS O-acetylase OafA/YrhL